MDYTALPILFNMEIKTLFQNIINELDGDNITKQRRRYLESYMEELDRYIKNHPDITQIPSSLELYCDLNPDAPECRKYDI
jgi:hypothetical protein